MSAPNPESQAERVKAAIFAGRKIEAIKLYREQTGLGLAESKAAVEKLEQELRTSQPDRFNAPTGKGCMSLVMGLTALGAVAWWLLRTA